MFLLRLNQSKLSSVVGEDSSARRCTCDKNTLKIS